MKKKKAPMQKFAKISEWIAAGNMATGLYLMEELERETEKAVGFKRQKINVYANLYPATVWFPKTQVQEVENDSYTKGKKRMWLVPAWLIKAKETEGYVIY